MSIFIYFGQLKPTTMKFSNLKTLLFATPALLIFLFGCTMEKRVHRDGYSFQWIKSKEAPQKLQMRSEARRIDTTVSSSESFGYSLTASNSLDVVEIQKSRQKNMPVLKSLVASSELCDVLTLKNGNDMLVKVVEIGINEIKYKDCDNLDGPVVIVPKADVFRIKYSNGKVETFTSNKEPSQVESYQEKVAASNPGTTVNVLAILSLVSGILAILVAIIPILGWLFGALGVLFGLMAIMTIKNNPEKFKGKGLAIAGAICGAAGFFLGILWFLINLWLLGYI